MSSNEEELSAERFAWQALDRVHDGVDSIPLALVGIGYALLAILAKLEDQ
jgi:hypothetical protein